MGEQRRPSHHLFSRSLPHLFPWFTRLPFFKSSLLLSVCHLCHLSGSFAFPLFALHAVPYFLSFFLPSWLLLTLLVEFSHLFSAFFLKFPHLDLPGRGHVRCCLVRRTNHKIEPPSLAPHHWSRDLHFTGWRQTHPLRHHRSQNSSHPVLSLITLLHLAGWLREENEITRTHTSGRAHTKTPQLYLQLIVRMDGEASHQFISISHSDFLHNKTLEGLRPSQVGRSVLL